MDSGCGLSPPMPKDEPGLRDQLTTAVVNAAPANLLKGGSAAAVGLVLLGITPFAPESWENWVQWPCFGLFVAGVLRSIHAVLR